MKFEELAEAREVMKRGYEGYVEGAEEEFDVSFNGVSVLFYSTTSLPCACSCLDSIVTDKLENNLTLYH